jgi:putative membrane protein
MTTASEPAPGLAAVERRLHPLSWLFLLLAQLRQFAIPLIALLLFGTGGDRPWELIGAASAVLLALGAVLQYFSYRFRIEADELTIRSGIFQRTVRHIPLRRIQNVALRRSLLHRLAGVAEVRLESAAGSQRAEAEMRVLSLADAAALEALVQASRRGLDPAADGQAGEGQAASAAPLLQLPTAELVRLGLASNRGMVVVAAALGALSQYARDGFGRSIRAAAELTTGAVRELMPGPTEWLAGVLVLLLAALLLLRLLSVVLAILRLHGFRLDQDGERLSVEAGLLTRLRGHASRHKIQRWMLTQNLWLRLMGRFGLRIETAAAHGPGSDRQALTELVPIAPQATVDALLQRWLPALDWPRLDWQPLHPQAWRRFLLPPLLLTVAATLLLVLRTGPWGLLLLGLLPLWWLRAWRLARWSGWWVDARFVAWRSGWPDRHWQLVEIDRIQLLRVEQSPFDRRRGMASLLIDTAGADPRQPALRLRYLPEDTVRELAGRLSRVGDS